MGKYDAEPQEPEMGTYRVTVDIKAHSIFSVPAEMRKVPDWLAKIAADGCIIPLDDAARASEMAAIRLLS